MIASLLSHCRPNSFTCGPVWDVVTVYPAIDPRDLITAAGILLFCWAFIAGVAVGGTLILERVSVTTKEMK